MCMRFTVSFQGDLWWWMQHPRCRDQFAVQYEKDGVPTVAVYWHIKGHDPEIAGDHGKAERPVRPKFPPRCIQDNTSTILMSKWVEMVVFQVDIREESWRKCGAM